MRFRTLYLIVDLLLVLCLALAVWPLLGMRQWYQLQRQRQYQGRLRPMISGLRLVWEIGLALTLLIAARLALHRMGAQSWFEGLGIFLDIGLWLWTISLLMLITGATRLVLLVRLLWRKHEGQELTPSEVPSLRHFG